MVASVAHEVPAGIAELRDQLVAVWRVRAEIDPVGDGEPAQLVVEADRLFHVQAVEADVSETAHLERALEGHPTDVLVRIN